MPWKTDDYECGKCGETHEILTGPGEKPKCPGCGYAGKKLKKQLGFPAYLMDIETWMEHQRGHLDSKVKKSMDREKARADAVARRRATVPGGTERIG